MHTGGGETHFSLVRGGPAYRLLRATGLLRGDRRDVVRLIAAAIAVTWVPLVVLASVSPTGEWVALRYLSAHSRLLVTLPSFLIAEASLHARTERCLDWFVRGNWAPGENAAIVRITSSISRLRDATLPEALILLAALASGQAVLWGLAEPLGARGIEWSPTRTPALIWYLGVALPILEFLALRWLWRWGLWALLLARLSLLRIRPIAIHPDRRGGLSFLVEPSVGFSWVILGNGAILAASWSNRLVYGTDELETFIPHAAVYLALSLALAFAPLLPFLRPLWRAYFDSIRSYGTLAADYTRRFDRRWVAERDPADELLGTSDIQSLADMGNAYEVLRGMQLLPITKRAFAVVAIAALLPFALLVLTEVRLLEIVSDMGATWLERSIR